MYALIKLTNTTNNQICKKKISKFVWNRNVNTLSFILKFPLGMSGVACTSSAQLRRLWMEKGAR